MANNIIDNIRQMASSSFNEFASKVNVVTYAPRSAEKVEKLFSLPKDMFEAVDFTNMGIIEEDKKYIPKFVKGERYALKGVCCEGFEMEEKVYELVGTVDEYNGVSVNSVIVKQLEGSKDHIFTLSKNDCDYIGIEYEQGLQLFPKWMDWRRVKDVIPFDKNDLSTTPLSDIDNTVRYVLLKLNGFKDYENGYVITPSGNLIKEKQFEDTIRVINNEPIAFGNGYIIGDKSRLNIEIVYPNNHIFKHGNFISDEGSVYILIKLRKKSRVLTNENASNTLLIDDYFGVERSYLSNFNPNEYFTVSWDELGSWTIEEYEAEKERKEKAKKERIAREEARARKRIEEEERRLREERKRVEDAVQRMKDFRIMMPNIPKASILDLDNTLSSLTMFADGSELFFKSLDASLNKIQVDLRKLEDIDKVFRFKGGNDMTTDIFEMMKL